LPAIEKLEQGGEPSKISKLYKSFGKSFLFAKVVIDSKNEYFGL